jgi:hypothetical protein
MPEVGSRIETLAGRTDRADEAEACSQALAGFLPGSWLTVGRRDSFDGVISAANEITGSF